MSVSWRGDLDGLSKGLDKLADFAPKELNEVIGETLTASTLQRFDDERGPDGRPWKRSYRAEAEGGQTLTDSARLKNSINYRATDRTVEVGTNVKYAAVHQEGKEIKAKNKSALRFQIGGRWARKKSVRIPARPFLGVSDEDAEEIDAVILEHVEERLK